MNVDDDASPPAMGGPPRSADAVVQADETRALVAMLPEPYRRVQVLRSEHQLSYPEIATILRIPLKTVESRVTRAFRTLRGLLAELR